MRKQRGFTAIEVLAILLTLCAIAGVGGLIYIAMHFISKFW
ncbi:prepilin-type N-terminal cleavage/methylation domain-containing protein [Paraburkholderia panacisoli]|nr:prepilin-type N-terminal cleavage/methylation domain-containing protein [Paraburkholderia panacisoli]